MEGTSSRTPPAAPGPPIRSASLPERFDAIVIGSGMGGLTCASLLAQMGGQRVLVLERHYRLGGFTHSFRRPGGRSWDVGLHYVGQMRRSDPTRGLMDLVTGGRVAWNEMPSPFERYVFPGFSFAQPAGRDACRAALLEHWPEERSGIDRYLRELTSGARWVAPHVMSQGGPVLLRAPAALARRLGRARALRTTREVLDACVSAPELKAVLAAQWGDYGLPPSQSAWVGHAVIANHYLDGGWYPEGGAGGIADGACRVIEAAGGACLSSHEVEQILVERGRAVGVRVRRQPSRGETLEFRAPAVISNAGARLTFDHLLRGHTGGEVDRLRARIRALPHGFGVVQLFLGLRESPACLGFRGENHWLYDDCDHDAVFARRNDLLAGRASFAYLSFPSLKDPTAPVHTAEIIAGLDHASVDAWQGTPWKRRGEEYEAAKVRMSDALLALVGQHYPGFEPIVDYRELATPLSVEHFAAHPAGAIYGLPGVPERYRIPGLGVVTPVDGLLLTGSDVAVHGIVGAMMGGAATAGHLLRRAGFLRIMARAQRETKRAPAMPAR
jgi:all-trans-retinol 13,14-reductase